MRDINKQRNNSKIFLKLFEEQKIIAKVKNMFVYVSNKKE